MAVGAGELASESETRQKPARFLKNWEVLSLTTDLSFCTATKTNLSNTIFFSKKCNYFNLPVGFMDGVVMGLKVGFVLGLLDGCTVYTAKHQ